MKNWWHKLSHLGVEESVYLEQHRDVILLNKINAVIAITMVIELFLEIILYIANLNNINVSTIRIILIAIVGVVNLYLSKNKKFTQAKLLLIIVIPLLLFVFPLVVGFHAAEIFLWYPYAAIAFSIMPLMVFRSENDKKLMVFSIAYLGGFVLFVDLFALYVLDVPNYVNYDPPRLIFAKLAQVGIFAVMIFSVHYLIKINTQFEQKLIDANNDILEKSELLGIRANELRIQNSLLSESEEELKVKNEELIKYQKELSSQNEELRNTMLELKTTQSHLIQSEKMASLGVLTAGIAHEINNPINYISSGVDGLKVLYDDTVELTKEQLLFRKENDSELQNKIAILQSEASILVDNIDKGIKRTTDIIRGLSKFSHMESNSLELCNINENIEATLSLISGQYRNRIVITKNFGDIPIIYCYPSSLGQVIINLITNAIQAIPEQGSIDVSTFVQNQFVVISVADTGVGIPDDLKSKIFEPFYTSKGIGKGTGLGLSITYGLVQKHKGSIELISKSGEGSVFKVFIPVDLEKQLS